MQVALEPARVSDYLNQRPDAKKAFVSITKAMWFTLDGISLSSLMEEQLEIHNQLLVRI